jgi:hypothetical protein
MSNTNPTINLNTLDNIESNYRQFIGNNNSNEESKGIPMLGPDGKIAAEYLPVYAKANVSSVNNISPNEEGNVSLTISNLPGAVSSVNSITPYTNGNISLDAADVGALPAQDPVFYSNITLNNSEGNELNAIGNTNIAFKPTSVSDPVAASFDYDYNSDKLTINSNGSLYISSEDYTKISSENSLDIRGDNVSIDGNTAINGLIVSLQGDESINLSSNNISIGNDDTKQINLSTSGDITTNSDLVNVCSTLNANRFQNKPWNPYNVPDQLPMPNITEVKGWYIAGYVTIGETTRYYLSDKQQYIKTTDEGKELIDGENASSMKTTIIYNNNKNKVVVDSLKDLSTKISSLSTDLKLAITVYDIRPNGQVSHLINKFYISNVNPEGINSGPFSKCPYIDIVKLNNTITDSPNIQAYGLADYESTDPKKTINLTDEEIEKWFVNDPFRFGIFISALYDITKETLTITNDYLEAGICNLTFSSFANGYSNSIPGWCSTALGRNNKVFGQYASALGRAHTVLGYTAIASGNKNIVESENSIVHGYDNKVYNGLTHAVFGRFNTINSASSSLQSGSLIAGSNNTYGQSSGANAKPSFMFGYGLSNYGAEGNQQIIIGRYNAPGTNFNTKQDAINANIDYDKLFIIGSGSLVGGTAKGFDGKAAIKGRNVFTVDPEGNTFALGNIKSDKKVICNTLETTKLASSSYLSITSSYLSIGGTNTLYISGTSTDDLKSYALGFGNNSYGNNCFVIGCNNNIGSETESHTASITLGNSLITSNRNQCVIGTLNANLDSDVSFAVGIGKTGSGAGANIKKTGLQVYDNGDLELPMENSTIYLNQAGNRYRIWLDTSDTNNILLKATLANN